MIKIGLAAVEFLLIVGASIGLSFIYLRRSLLSNRVDTLILRIILGFATIIGLTFLAGIFALLNPVFFIALIIAGNGFLIRYRGRIEWPGPVGGFSVLTGVLAAFIAVNLFYSMFPPTFYDSMLYHLAIPSYYVQHGAIVPWVENFNSNLPLNGEMLFTFSLLGGTVHIAKWISFLSGLLLISLLFSWYRQGKLGKYPLVPVLIFYTIPQFGFLTVSAKTDVLGMLFMLAGCRLYFYFKEQSGQKSLLWLSGICWGLAIGTKYIFAFFLVGFMVSLLFVREIALRQRVAAITILAVCVLICLTPWLVKNTVITGNPVYPYLNRVFKSESWSPQQGSEFASALKRGSRFDIVKLIYYPLEILLKPYRYGMTAVLGVLLLFCLPFLILVPPRSESRVMMLMAGASFLVLLLFARVPRYFLPAFLLLAMPMAAGLERLTAGKARRLRLGAPLLLMLLVINLVQLVDLQERFSKGFAYLARKVSGNEDSKRVKYLYILPYYRAFEFMNRHLNPGHRVAFLGEDRTFYLERDFIASSFNDRNMVLYFLKASSDFSAFRESLKARGITHILYSEKGLARLARFSSLYRVRESDKKKLDNYLSRLAVVYRDARYRIYAL